MKEIDHEYQKAVNYLCSMIENGTLSIGSRLPTERAIAETLSISRNSTREALRTLENMGAIESRHGSGSYLVDNMEKAISQMTQLMIMMHQTTKEEICSFRRNMEKAVCLSIIEKPDKINWILQAEKLLENWTTKTMEEEIDADRQFHYLLIQATENQFWITLMGAITDVYRKWIDSVLRCTDSSVKKSIDHAHFAILEALKRNDRIACEKAIDLHYDLIDRELWKA